MEDSFNVGVITEAEGPHLAAYLQSLSICRGIKQVAIADLDGRCFDEARSILRESFPNLQTFRDDLDMLREVCPRLTLVTLEASRAPEAIQHALEAGSHVLTEKPACVCPDDFQQLVRAAESKGLHLMLALANRVSPPFQKARALVATGMFGRLYGANLYTLADQTRLKSRDFQRSWFASKARAGGGHLIWLGIHWLDLIQFISGHRISQVAGFARTVGRQPIDVEDAAVLALEFQGGMLGTMHSGYYLDRGYQNYLALWGAQGWLRCDLTTGSSLEWYSTSPGAPSVIQRESYVLDSNLYGPFVEAAVDCARGAGPEPVSGAEGLQVLKVVFGLYRASETGMVQTIL